MIIHIILAVFAAVVLTSWFYRYNYSGRLISKVPGPKGLPILGNTLDIALGQEKLFAYTRTLRKSYGNISKFHCFFINAVNIYAPEDYETIMSSSKNNVKEVPYKFMKPWFGEGLLINNGEKWHHRRKMLTPAFHFNILKKFARTFTEQADEFVEKLQTETQKDKTDIFPIITRHTLRIMCETSMGTTMNEGIKSVSNKYFTALYILGQCLIHRLVRVWLYPDIVFALSNIAYLQRKATTDLHRFTKQIIQERREFRQQNNIEFTSMIQEDEMYGRKNRLAMLDLLLDQEQQGNIDDQGIREEVDIFMFEGHDTTAAALGLMTMLIANEPEAQEKIYQELYSIFGDSDREPSIEELNRMKYLECCIKESLRLYPSVYYIARTLCEDVVLSGYKIPAGTICSLHIFDLHRREDIFPEPDKFIPERFLPENTATRHAYAYLPFSAGPRNCIGQKFAILEMKAIICGMVRKYHLEPVTKPEDCQFVSDLVLRTKNPIYVRFRNRVK